MNDPNAAELIFVLVFYGVLFTVILGVQLLVCYLLYNSAKSLPERYQETPPGLAFLLLIPLFSLVWLFIYLPKVSRSFQDFFRAHQQRSDDCGEQFRTLLGDPIGLFDHPLCRNLYELGELGIYDFVSGQSKRMQKSCERDRWPTGNCPHATRVRTQAAKQYQ